MKQDKLGQAVELTDSVADKDLGHLGEAVLYEAGVINFGNCIYLWNQFQRF